MKLIVSCTPFEFIPHAVLNAFTRTIMRLASNWGLNVEVHEDSTVDEAVQRHFQWQKAKDSLHG